MIQRKLLLLANDKKKKNFMIYGIGQAFNLLSPLIVAPLIVFVCKEEGLGKTGMGFAMSLFLILIVDYAFDVKGTKEVSENRDDKQKLQKILNVTLQAKIILLLFAIAIATILICFVPFFHQEPALFYFSLSIVIAQVFNPIWFLQGIENFGLVSAINIASKVSYVILVYMFIKNPDDYRYVNLFLGCSALIFNIIGIVAIKLMYGYEIMKPNFNEIWTILKVDFTFCISQLILSVRQLSPLIMTGYFLGYFYAGQYKIIEQVITLFRTALLVYLKFFYPSLCYKMLDSPKHGLHYWKKYTSLNFLLIIIALTGIFIYAENILQFFHAQEDSIGKLLILFRFSLLIPLLMAINLPLEQLMFTLNKSKIYIRIVITVALLNLILVVVLINAYYLSGVVAALIVSEVLFAAFYFKNAFLSLKKSIG